MSQLLPRFEMESGTAPSAAVILLHGLGANGHDFAPLVDALDLHGCRDIRFVFPHAPVMPVTVNNGHRMPAWYDIRSLDLAAEQDVAGIQASELAVLALIAHEVRRGIAPEHIVLAGFSQGAAMTLHTGLRHPFTLAGIMALSGYLLLPDRLGRERAPANAHTPIFLAHGEHDSIVLPQRGAEARDALLALGHPVQWQSYAAEHEVTPEEVQDMAAFLRRVLAAPT